MESSIYGKREPGDCRKHVRHALIYDGTSAVVPTLENSTIIFGGAISTEMSAGIGHLGHATLDGALRIDYADILSGGSGTRYRGSVDSLAKKIRLACRKKLCGEEGDRFYLEIKKVQDCFFPIPSEWEFLEPIEIGFECNCLETCCQRLSKAAYEINRRPEYPFTATVVNSGSDYFLDLTGKNAGQDWIVVAKEGFTKPKELVPYMKQQLTAKDVAFWFPTEIPLLRDNPTKKMTVIELYYKKYYPKTELVGMAGSNEMADIYRYDVAHDVLMIVFDTATTQSNTALGALVTILTGVNAYTRKLGSTVVQDRAFYRYMITVTDAGDAAALTSVREDYTTNVVQIDRSAYKGGVSYYTMITTSATPLAAVNGGEVVTPGQFVTDDLPVTADTCPVPENSVCLECL